MTSLKSTLPTLSLETLSQHDPQRAHGSQPIDIPESKSHQFPEKIIQFGTGALLRGLTDFVIHQANQQGIFKGKILAVQSTGTSRAQTINHQNGLFTQLEEGYHEGKEIRKFIVNNAIHRALSAIDSWEEILESAKKPEMQIVLSNTTEVGLRYESDDIYASPPKTFPAKLTSWLYTRFKHFHAEPESGVVILPSELILNNGDVLKDSVLQHVQAHGLESAFTEWIDEHCVFCNTLVDRIVTGKPQGEKLLNAWEDLGYQDEMLTVNEVYKLWAIEGAESLKDVLEFIQVDPGVILSEDISPFRERKLRILNGSHTISVALAYLLQIDTIYDCMYDPEMSEFIRRVIEDEIVPTLPVAPESARAFASEVQDRFRNPFLNHKVLSITLQYTTKMNARNVPTFFRYYDQKGTFPPLMALGLAAYVTFLNPVKKEDNRFYGEWLGNTYPINDDKADYFFQQKFSGDDAFLLRSKAILSDETLWDPIFLNIPGLIEAVQAYQKSFQEIGVRATLQKVLLGFKE